MTKSKKLDLNKTKEYFPKTKTFGKYKSEEEIIKERKKREKEMVKEDKELLAKQKSYEELIKPVSGIVKSVKGYNMATNHTPMKEMVMGGRFPVYKTGYQSNLEIIIEGDNIVKKLLFNGNIPIKADDQIKAYILAEEKKELNSSYSTPPFRNKEVSIPRKLSEQETALYIELIEHGKVVRTDYSVDYKPTK